ncbi:hypothetical protein PVAP13_8KG332201 [Panicum virgatum]|uniref:Uncharacterized protein n=1 Tax=Panicum virgatum TaxID=38727 RepID=A0A8T0PMR9_PANVG|nr:hypothetical protein PVAP13_8KG332201 [Panicum virgatum]
MWFIVSHTTLPCLFFHPAFLLFSLFIVAHHAASTKIPSPPCTIAAAVVPGSVPLRPHRGLERPYPAGAGPFLAGIERFAPTVGSLGLHPFLGFPAGSSSRSTCSSPAPPPGSSRCRSTSPCPCTDPCTAAATRAHNRPPRRHHDSPRGPWWALVVGFGFRAVVLGAAVIPTARDWVYLVIGGQLHGSLQPGQHTSSPTLNLCSTPAGRGDRREELRGDKGGREEAAHEERRCLELEERLYTSRRPCCITNL